MFSQKVTRDLGAKLRFVNNCFFDTISHLRTNEELILFPRMDDIPEEEINSVADYLERDFSRECLDYPEEPPSYDRSAAVWSALTLYHAAQLLLNRRNLKRSMDEYITPYTGAINADAVISADLCLRFLPAIVKKARIIDPEDELIGKLMGLLGTWSYSGISLEPGVETLDLSMMTQSNCLRQLFVDRIIDNKAKSYLESPELRTHVLESLGNHQSDYCQELISHED